MAIKKNTGVAPTTVEAKKGAAAKAVDQPVVDPQAAKEASAAKRVNKHNHELERMRNAKPYTTSKDVAKGGNKSKNNDLSMLESSIKASAAAKAARGKPAKTSSKKKSSDEEA